MRNKGVEILRAAGLPDSLGDVWVCEALVDTNGATTYHIDQLADILSMNDTQIGRGWSAGFVPFAFCKSVEHAVDTCERMRRKQQVLTALSRPCGNCGLPLAEQGGCAVLSAFGVVRDADTDPAKIPGRVDSVRRTSPAGGISGQQKQERDKKPHGIADCSPETSIGTGQGIR